jgi:ATP-dependent Clp protease ATP-binding subunit ClpA
VLSRNLEKSLHRALAQANERRHEYATLEHLLLALTEDQDAVVVLRVCDVDLDRLRRAVLNYVDNELANLVAAHSDDAKPTASFQRVLQRAAIHVQSSGCEEVTGANVLVAMFAERESHAVYFLQEQDMTRFDAVNYISHGVAKGSGRSEARRVQGSHPGARPAQGVLGRGWGDRGPMAAPYIPSGGTGWGMWGPVQFIKGRLAFMKAEL